MGLPPCSKLQIPRHPGIQNVAGPRQEYGLEMTSSTALIGVCKFKSDQRPDLESIKKELMKEFRMIKMRSCSHTLESYRSSGPLDAVRHKPMLELM
jgi:hypothetical protein